MKKRIKDICLGLLIGIVLTSTTPVVADTIKQKIEVVLNSINININNVILAQQNENYVLSNGQEVPYSILYKGTTYLPMRIVAENVGKTVKWEQETKTASICDKIKETGDGVSEINLNIKNIEDFKKLFVSQTEYSTITIGKHKHSGMQFNYEGNLTNDELIQLIDTDAIKNIVKDYMIKLHTEYGEFCIQFYNNSTKQLINYNYILLKKADGSFVFHTLK